MADEFVSSPSTTSTCSLTLKKQTNVSCLTEKITTSPALPGSPLPTAQNWSLSNKYLGYCLDSSVSFNIHIDSPLAKIKAKLDFLYQNKPSFKHSTKCTLVKMHAPSSGWLRQHNLYNGIKEHPQQTGRPPPLNDPFQHRCGQHRCAPVIFMKWWIGPLFTSCSYNYKCLQNNPGKDTS